MSMHNLGSNLQENSSQQRTTPTTTADLPWPNNLALLQQQIQQQQQQHQQVLFLQDRNSGSSQQRAHLHSQQQHGSHVTPTTAALQSSPTSLSFSLASRVDQLIRTTLYDSQQMSRATITHSGSGSSNNNSNSNNTTSNIGSSNSSKMPSPTSSSTSATSSSTSSVSSIAVNSPNLFPSSIRGQNFNTFSGQPHQIGPMSSSSLTSLYNSTAQTSSVDTLADNSNMIINNNNNNNLSTKISAHSASHSALAAAAALQSLNQSHLQRFPLQSQNQQFMQSNNPTRHQSNSLPVSMANMPKLGVTSTTSSDHHNHDHMALPGQPMIDNADLLSLGRIPQKSPSVPQLAGLRHPVPGVNWPPTSDPSNLNGVHPRWLYPNPYTSSFAPTPTSLAVSAAIAGRNQNMSNNMGNSNQMIGQDGDNQANNALSRIHNSNNHSSGNIRNDLRQQPVTSQQSNQFTVPQTHPSLARHSIPWQSDNLKGPSSASNQALAAAVVAQSQRFSEEMERNSDRLSLFTCNLLNSFVPGTNKPKRVIPLDSVENLRQAIHSGEFYVKFEELAYDILTNQVFVPEFPIIEYLSQDKFGRHELERMENLHKRIGISNIISSLRDISHQRSSSVAAAASYLSAIKSSGNDAHHTNSAARQSQLHSDNPISTGNNFIGNHPMSLEHQQQLHAHKGEPFLPPQQNSGKPNMDFSQSNNQNLLSVDKNRRSSQSPSDIASRSQHGLSNGQPQSPRLAGGNFTQNTYLLTCSPHLPGMAQSGHMQLPGQRGAVGGPSNVTGMGQLPAHARLSPFQPAGSSVVSNSHVGSRPPRSHSVIGPGAAHDPTLTSVGFNSSPQQPIRQPPAAHQSSSSRPSTLTSGPLAHAHSSSSLTTGPPITAHLSSKAPQTPRLHDSAPVDIPPKLGTSQDYNSPGGRAQIDQQQSNNNKRHYQNPELPPPSKSADLMDPALVGLPVQTLLGLKQHELVNRDMAMKRSQAPPSGGNGSHNFSGPHGFEPARSPSTLTAPGSDPHMSPRSPMNSHQFQSNYNPPLGNITSGAMFRHPSCVPANSMLPPGSFEFSRGFGPGDPRATMLSPGMGALSNNSDLQLKQYSALMSAYQQQQQHHQQLQQQHQMLSTNKGHSNPGPNIQSSGMNRFLGPSMGSPLGNMSEPMHLDIQHHQQPLLNAMGQQQNGHQQRSIITGSAAAGTKKNKRAKQSPTATSQDDKAGSMALSPNVDPVKSNNQLAGLPDQVIPPDNVAADPSNSHSSINQITPQQQQQLSALFASSLVDARSKTDQSAPTAYGDSLQQAVPAPLNAPLNQNDPASHTNISESLPTIGAPTPVDIGFNDTCAPAKAATPADESIQFNNNVQQSTTSCTPHRQFSDISSSLVTDDVSVSKDPNERQIQTPQIVEPSKYQKLYTKKAWLKNYDQEDQEARTRGAGATDNEMTQYQANEKQAEEPVSPALIDAPIFPSDKACDIKPAKTIDTKAPETGKKKAKPDNKKGSALSSSSSKLSRANKTASTTNDQDSDVSNASTSDLEFDEAEMKSTNEKRPRRTPRRKAKPSSSEKEENLSKSKQFRDSARKRGKSDRVEEISGKRKLRADEDITSLHKKTGEKFPQADPSYDIARKRGKADKVEEISGKRKIRADEDISSLHKKTGEKFPQADPSYDIVRKKGKADRVEEIGGKRKIRADEDITSLHKKTGEKFLQTDPCYDIVPKSIRCLECRRVRQSNARNDKTQTSKQSKTNWDDFCRFYEFRKLRYNKSSQIVVAGFSDLDDAKESDLALWLPKSGEEPPNLTYKTARFILANIGEEFCNLVMQEREAVRLHESIKGGPISDRRVTWKRAVNGLRELCDVCATTLFNCHYVCERCGFVVCIDCQRTRAKVEMASGRNLEVKNDSDISVEKSLETGENGQTDSSEQPQQSSQTVAKKNKRDSFSWIYCARNEEHSHDKLILTQIIAGDCLEQVWNLLHQVRKDLGFEQCTCSKFSGLESNKSNSICGSRENVKVKLEKLDDCARDEKVDGAQNNENHSSNWADVKSEDSQVDLSERKFSPRLDGIPYGIEHDSDQQDVTIPNRAPNCDEPTTHDQRIGDIVNDVINSLPVCRSPRSKAGHGAMFTDDFGTEDDSQEDTKLSQQVTAAIEGCISSLPNGPGSPALDSKTKSNDPSIGPAPVSSGQPSLQITRNKLEPANVDTTTSTSRVEAERGNIASSDICSWLCEGDLLVLSNAKHKMNVELFQGQWIQGKPVLVRGVDQLMKIDMWLPQFFGKEFGDYRSDLVDCRNGDIHRHSMKKYWEGFEPLDRSGGTGSKKKANTGINNNNKDDGPPAQIPTANNEECSNGPSYYSGSALWRLKDWPPGQDFYEILPSHYEDFMNNLPLRAYTTRSGQLNLACRLPREMLKPDLGPKMYSAYGTSNFPERGTTNLHLDISDAINVMVYVSGANLYKNGSEEAEEQFEKTIEGCIVDGMMKSQIRARKYVPGALWHVFKPSDAQKMRSFLNKVSDERNISPDKRTDPIHDQTWYLDQVLLDRLEREYGVKSYAILQCMGDAILIPAGAPHQVKNLHNCIKVANDFVSPENVRYCVQLTHEFRRLPETHINQEDKLQIKNILYHSVKESLQYIKLYQSGKIDPKEDEAKSATSLDDDSSEHGGYNYVKEESSDDDQETDCSIN